MRWLSLLLLLGCAQPPSPSAPTSTSAPAETVSLRAVNEATAEVWFAPAPNDPPRRMMELHLAAEGLGEVTATPGDAVTAANKRLVLQQTGDTLRLLVFATDNDTPLGPGLIARLRGAPAGPARLRLIDRRPIFAPAAGDRGVTLGPPVTLGGL